MTTQTKKQLGIILVLVLIIGIIFMIQRNPPVDLFLAKDHTTPTKADQIAYLKKHEKEMTDYIKSQNPKVTSVQWDWKSVKIEEVQPNAGGIPTGDKYNVMLMEGGFNNIKESNFGVTWQLPDNSYYPKMSAMYLNSSLMYLNEIDGVEVYDIYE